jgi:LAO/AO transport system kinase
VTGGDAAPGARARADAILAGDLRTAARLMRDLDDRRPDAIAALKQLFPHTGRAYIVGVTGNPGAGKSTLVDALIAHYRAAGERVGVVCVDPTSPFSGGAILGDRVRMQRHALDPGVFIRSLATRGHLGGLSRSTFDVVHVLDAMGFSRILIETVGVGQDEIDVMRAAHTTVVVAVPGLGDAIQAIKSGLLEIADVLAVNKADRDGAARTERDLRHMLELRAADGHRQVDVIRTIATRGAGAGAGVGAGAGAGAGIVELAAAIEAHRARIAASPDAAGRAQARACAQLTDLVRALLADRAARALEAHGGLAELASAVAQHRADPWTLAEQLVDAL